MIKRSEFRNYAFNLPIQEMDRVAALSIEKYHRDAHPNVASYVIYRVWNAVKAIFGRSDWQITKNGISFAVKVSSRLKGKDPSQTADCYLKHAKMAIDLFYQFAKQSEIDENLFKEKLLKNNASFAKEMGLD